MDTPVSIHTPTHALPSFGVFKTPRLQQDKDSSWIITICNWGLRNHRQFFFFFKVGKRCNAPNPLCCNLQPLDFQPAFIQRKETTMLQGQSIVEPMTYAFSNVCAPREPTLRVPSVHRTVALSKTRMHVWMLICSRVQKRSIEFSRRKFPNL
jgi:hypothetical protein